MVILLFLLACAGPGATVDTSAPAQDDSSAEDTGGSDDTAGDTAGDSGDTAEPVDPYDLDADGYRSPEGGGDDCDDANATVYPGAPEICDPVDHDCDGEALEPGVCGAEQSGPASFRPIARIDVDREFYTSINLLKDLDGDALAELAIGCAGGCDGSGQVNVYAGGTFPAAPATPTRDAGVTYLQDASLVYVGMELPDVGDVDGDGANDVGLVAHEGAYGVYVHHGPIDLVGGETWMATGADARLAAGYAGSSWGFPVADGADYDGDGRDDVAVSVYTDVESDDSDLVHVFFGGAASDEEHVGIRGAYGASVVQVVDDLDLDGVADLVVVNQSIVCWIGGADLRTANGAPLGDLAAGQFRSEGDIRELPTHAWAPLGDWDGDGYPEVAGGAGFSSAGGASYGQAYIFGGDLRGEIPVEEFGSFTAASDLDQGLGFELTSADVDGDGERDLLVAGGWSWYLIPSSNGIPAPRSPIPQRSLAFADMGLVSAGHDYTGDGIDDWAAFTDDGKLGVYAGWAIPWDESEWW